MVKVRTLCRLVKFFHTKPGKLFPLELRQPSPNCSHIVGICFSLEMSLWSKALRLTLIVTEWHCPNLEKQPQTKSAQKPNSVSLRNCVVFVVAAPERHLVSGGSDNRLIVWEAQNGKVSHLFHQKIVFLPLFIDIFWNVLCHFQFIQSVECKGHTGPVCAVDAIYVEDSKILVASSASDSTVRLWQCSEAKEGERQTHFSVSLWSCCGTVLCCHNIIGNDETHILLDK